MNLEINNNTALTPEEKWENATIANNFIFYKVMRSNPDVCKRLLEILLEIEIDKINIYQEETIDVDYASKGVRLDVYAKNATQAFNVEMQTTNSKELAERSRYYQGIIDVDCLKSGQQYKDLKDSYVIFICIDDIFEKGRTKYVFENICIDDPSVKLNDRSHKCFFIASNCDKIITNKEQYAFLKMVIQNKSESIFTDKILDLVMDAKKNIQWKRQYMDLEREKLYAYDDGLEKGLAQGLEEGAKKKAVEAARNFLKMNIVTVEQIASAVGLSVEEVKALKDTLE